MLFLSENPQRGAYPKELLAIGLADDDFRLCKGDFSGL
jgi:hypothetical protein